MNDNETAASPESDHLATSIYELGFSTRVLNALNDHSIATVGDLIRKTEWELSRYRNLGKLSLKEIKTKLDTLGLHLAFGPPVPGLNYAGLREELTKAHETINRLQCALSAYRTRLGIRNEGLVNLDEREEKS